MDVFHGTHTPVDFSRQMVVLSAKGTAACDETIIDSISESDELVVTVRDREIDEKHCGCVSAAMNPIHAVVTERLDPVPRFSVQRVISCDRF